jgi:hypothetical protein
MSVDCTSCGESTARRQNRFPPAEAGGQLPLNRREKVLFPTRENRYSCIGYGYVSSVSAIYDRRIR